MSLHALTAPETRRSVGARAHRNTDDEDTLDAPAPSVPPGTPSPLGDEEAPRPSAVLGAPACSASHRPIGARDPSETREAAHAARAAREVARTARLEERRLRLVVLAIWSVAVTFAALFAYIAMR